MISPVEVVFFGTPPFAVPSLARLVGSETHRVLAVVTQPDRPRGRGLLPSPPAVKTEAQNLGLPVWQPEALTGAWVERILESGAQAAVVVAFGQKVPSPLLVGFRHGCINVHPSLLPRYRGAAPIQRAIIDGCALTGVTTMYLSEGWDSGDVIFQEEVPISPEDTGQTLHDRLAEAGSVLLVRTLEAVARASAPRVPQDEQLATWARRLTTEDARIDWTRPARSLHNLIRALTPQPGAWTTHDGKTVKILSSRVGPDSTAAAPGTVLTAGGEGLSVQAGAGTTLILETIQPAGKKGMSADAYLRGHRLSAGEVFR